MVFAAAEPRNHEQSGEDNDQDDGHDKSAANEAAGTRSDRIFFHWTDLSILNDRFGKIGHRKSSN
jgi:hypothetical protein